MPYLYKLSAQIPWTDCATLIEGAHQQITGGLIHSVKQDFYSQLAETAINNIGCLLDMNDSAVGFFSPGCQGASILGESPSSHMLNSVLQLDTPSGETGFCLGCR